MRAGDIMTANPVCCTADATLTEVARLMKERDCGEIPIVESDDNKRLVGVITDRDITIRAVAEGRNPGEVRAEECMSRNPATVSPETALEECIHIMEQKQIRRIPVVDGGSVCCGILAQADIALHTGEHETAEVVREVSRH